MNLFIRILIGVILSPIFILFGLIIGTIEVYHSLFGGDYA